MSAADHIHPGQLAMLMPAHAVTKLRYGDSYNQTPESRLHMEDEKRHRNAPLIGPPAPWQQRMEPHMDKAITVFHRGEGPEIWDGHHRAVHGIDTDPNREMLVSHDSDEAIAHRYKASARMRKIDSDRIKNKGKR